MSRCGSRRTNRTDTRETPPYDPKWTPELPGATSSTSKKPSTSSHTGSDRSVPDVPETPAPQEGTDTVNCQADLHYPVPRDVIDRVDQNELRTEQKGAASSASDDVVADDDVTGNILPSRMEKETGVDAVETRVVSNPKSLPKDVEIEEHEPLTSHPLDGPEFSAKHGIPERTENQQQVDPDTHSEQPPKPRVIPGGLIIKNIIKKWGSKYGSQNLTPGYERPEIDVTLGTPPPYEELVVPERHKQILSQYQNYDWRKYENPMEDTWCAALSIIAHCGVVVWLAVLLWRLDVLSGFTLADPVLITAAVLFVVCYVTVLLECSSSYALKYLHNCISYQEAQQHIKSLRKTPPKVVLSMKYKASRFREKEKKESSATRKEKKGDPENLNAEGKIAIELPVRACTDVSGDITIHPGRITRVEVNKVLGFVDEENARKYRRIKREMLTRYLLDPDEKIRLEVNLPEANERMSVYYQGDGKPRLLRVPCFWACALVLLAWPFRAWMRATTAKVNFTVIKLVELDDEWEWVDQEDEEA